MQLALRHGIEAFDLADIGDNAGEHEILLSVMAGLVPAIHVFLDAGF
jgi:hypothetical protein